MNWNQLTAEEQLTEIKALSSRQPVAIFKHSIRCAISSMVRSRLEREQAPANVSFYFLDLIRYRNVSDRIAHDFQVAHESPQMLLIRDGQCVYHESHNGISMEELVEHVV